ncbi:unnamed protein product, partial [Prorocentrum cordatum]
GARVAAGEPLRPGRRPGGSRRPEARVGRPGPREHAGGAGAAPGRVALVPGGGGEDADAVARLAAAPARGAGRALLVHPAGAARQGWPAQRAAAAGGLARGGGGPERAPGEPGLPGQGLLGRHRGAHGEAPT